MKKILITGGNGQVAFDLKRLAKQQHIKFYAPSREELQIADFNAVRFAIESFQPDVVINTAAYTRVDQAEKESESAFAANYYGAKNVAIVCEANQCPLIHLSTDYVFNGQSNKPYSETDVVSPINVYGESKYRGEEVISDYCKKYIILRVSAVFGMHGNNFVKTIIRLAQHQETLRIVSDQITCPTPSMAIAETLLTLSDSSQWGVYHYCGSEAINWYEFAKEIVDQAAMFTKLSVQKIDPILTKEYPAPAKRPLYSVLNCKKITDELSVHQPDWKAGLNHVISELYTA